MRIRNQEVSHNADPDLHQWFKNGVVDLNVQCTHSPSQCTHSPSRERISPLGSCYNHQAPHQYGGGDSSAGASWAQLAAVQPQQQHNSQLTKKVKMGLLPQQQQQRQERQQH